MTDRDIIRALIAESEEERGWKPDRWCPECRELTRMDCTDGPCIYVCPDCGQAYAEDDETLLDYEPEPEDEEGEAA